MTSENKKKGKFYAGVRWGLGTPTVIEVAMAPEDPYGPKLVAVHEYYKESVTIEAVVEEAKAIQERFPILRWFCLDTEPRYIREFRKAQLRALPWKFEEGPGINLVRSMLVKKCPYGEELLRTIIKSDTQPGGISCETYQGLFLMPNACPELAIEFQRFSNKPRDPNKPYVDKPIQAHNFALTAFTLIALGLGFRPEIVVRFL